jgi:hypothetical protein
MLSQLLQDKLLGYTEYLWALVQAVVTFDYVYEYGY